MNIPASWRILAAAVLCALGGSAFADLAVLGGRVYAMTDPEPLAEATVLIADGRIEAVGPDLEVPFDYRQIDARGKIVTPGFIESYSQLGIVEISAEETTVDMAVSEYPLGPAFNVRYALNPASTLFAVNRMDGVTRAMVAPRPGVDPLAGFGALVRLGGGAALVQPEAALFGQVGASAAAFTGGSRAALLQRLIDAFDEAARFSPSRYEPTGADYSRQDMAALKAFLRSGKPLVLEVNRASDILRCVELAQDRDLDLILLGGAEAWQVRERLAAAGVKVIVNVHSNLPRSFETLGARLDNAALLRSAGVEVLFTAGNSHNARNLRQLAGNAVAEGMPWHDALEALTRKAALAWGMPDVGILRPGAAADLVVWSGDPLELTSWADQVVIDGQLMPMRSRQTRLFERYKDLKRPYGYH